MSFLSDILRKSEAFKSEAHKILGIYESSKSRIIMLNDTYSKLKLLSLQQDDLFRQALRCIEKECYRAAHVMGWSALIDLIENKMVSSSAIKKLRSMRPKWNISSLDDLREISSEHQIIQAFRDMGFCNKTEEKALLGLLNKRNECGHPSEYYPQLNDTLGYISELIERAKALKDR